LRDSRIQFAAKWEKNTQKTHANETTLDTEARDSAARDRRHARPRGEHATTHSNATGAQSRKKHARGAVDALQSTHAMDRAQPVSGYTHYSAHTEAHDASAKDGERRQRGCGPLRSDPCCGASTEDLTKGRYNADTAALMEGRGPERATRVIMHTQTLSQFAGENHPL